jgi:hypothetical protein
MFDIATKVHRPGRPLKLVVAVGFLPLLTAPLVPYNTVGTLIAVILLMSGIMTILILVAFLKTWDSRFFPMADARRTTTFNCGDALFAGITGMVFVAVTIHSMFAWERAYLPWFLAAERHRDLRIQDGIMSIVGESSVRE